MLGLSLVTVALTATTLTTIGGDGLVGTAEAATKRSTPPCQAAFPDARRKTIGKTTWYNRQESVRMVLCYRFGLEPSADFPISSSMVCGMLAQVIGKRSPKLGVFADGACSGADLADDPKEPVKYLSAACSWASDVLGALAKPAGVLGSLGCTLAPSAGHALGSMFESKHEFDVAVDVTRHGKCIKYSPTHFGSPWLADDCASGDKGFATLPVYRPRGPLAPQPPGGGGGGPGGGDGGTPIVSPVETSKEEAARALRGVRVTTTVYGTTCALFAAEVACWGGGSGEGELGNAGDYPASAGVSYVPLRIPNLLQPIAVAASPSSNCAMLADGRSMCWGINNEGQEGNGIVNGPFGCRAGFGCSPPMEVLGLRNVTEFTGSDGKCALVQSGHVYCWGRGDVGELGNGEFGPESECNGGPCSPTPVEVQGISNAVEIAGAWDGHICAVLATGELKCWGNNSNGQLGIGSYTGPEECADGAAVCSAVPIAVAGITSAVEVRVGPAVTCVLLANGTVRCWGRSALLRGESATPVEIEGLHEATHFAKASPQVSEFLCVLRSSGGVSCWGGNREGSLGNGEWSGGPNPSNVSGVTSAVELAIAAEAGLACARLASGEVNCWGTNYHGELGNGTGGEVGEEGLRFSGIPVKVLGIDNAVSISVGDGLQGGYACAILADETEKCWGENLYGQLGNGHGGYKNYPPAEGESLVRESSNRPVFVKRPE